MNEAGHVSEETYSERIARAEPQFGDILYSREGTYFGIAAEMPRNQRVCLGQRMVLIRPNPAKINSRFLRLWLNSPILSRHIHGFRDGTVAERLNMPTIRGLPVPIFQRDDQNAIAELLGAIDDKIELNRRMNETLEAMAQAIFRDWFVDFGPTRRKIDGAPDPFEIMGGLVADPDRARQMADLFPASMGDNGLPEGWHHDRLGNLVTNVIERCVPSEMTRDRPYVPIDTITARSLVIQETRPGSEAQSSLIAFRQNDILFGAMRPYFHKVALAHFEGTTRTTVFVLRPKIASDLGFALMTINDGTTIEYATQHSSGTTIPYAVWRNSLERMLVPCPPREVRVRFGHILEPMLNRMQASASQNRTLSATHDLLLPKLMSGEIRLRDVEARLEAAQ
ncbi:restriction endonuclease subunit S [Mesorhizobium sp.]|uniref:restriction endonuclease subunit S n=1 Tax=Mesorhizobium sp. TaxID=1871066 RepID=UPI0025EA4E4E|nr:restriction endonuclease subunit S [Mesorhizobium sp.]